MSHSLKPKENQSTLKTFIAEHPQLALSVVGGVLLILVFLPAVLIFLGY